MSDSDSEGKTIGKTILVVEDEALLREMIHSILESRGYRVLAADSGRAALDVWNLEKGKIDLLLTDIIMPRGVTGLDLARRLLTSKPGLKIIFTTGSPTRVADHATFQRLNARLLPKPYEAIDLVQIVEETLNGVKSGTSQAGA